MDQWQETACFVPPDGKGLSHVVCDPYKELVWVAGAAGVVSSFFGPAISAYSSFVVGDPVLDIQVSDRFVYTLTKRGVFTHRRTGQIRSHHELHGRFMLLFESDMLIATQRRILRHNLDTMRETGIFTIETPDETTEILFLRKCLPYGFVVGLSNGTAQVIDPNTFETLFTIRCHSGPLSDLDCKKSVIMTCGLSSRRYGVVADQMVYVWDVRNRKPLPPLNLVDGAQFVSIHPRSPTNCTVISKSDQLHFMDVKNPSNITIRQVVAQSPITGMDMGLQGDTLVVIEENGSIHHWSRTLPMPAEYTPKNLDLPTLEEPQTPINSTTPLSSIGLPYYTQELLSSWSDDLVFSVGMPSGNTSGNSNTATKYECVNQKHRRGSIAPPKFLSERERLGLQDDDNKDIFTNDNSLALGKVPRAYRKQEIQFSKFGVQDFDFKFYNRSVYSGLENERPGSNALNALVQLFRWCQPIHNLSLSLLSRHADLDLPVLSELAILFDMLHKAQGRQSRASNFLCHLSQQPELVNAGLLEPGTPTSSLVSTLFKYILSALLQEEAPFSEDIADAVGIEMNCRVYGSCGYKADQKSSATSIDAISADHKGINGALNGTTDSWSYCEKCDTNHSMAVFRQVCGTSQVFFVNALSHTAANPIARKIGFTERVDKRSLRCVDSEQANYTLTGYIAEITNDSVSHAVSVVKLNGQWHMFNDFLVTPISEDEAMDFTRPWKQVLILMYLRNDAASTQFDYENWKSNMNTSILYTHNFVSGNTEYQSKARQLTPGEIQKGDLVALDAEFVLLGQEIAEIHSDGSKRLLKPRTMSLARVSVVRGTSDMTPFIDDLIEISEPIVNYLTLYSGIEPGDLDPEKSPYGLVKQQTATRRLWILLNMGVIFVGHALVNDFRTINLQVPPDQVLDTSELFFDKSLSGGRRMSLKFLFWALFGDEIQTGNHDSIEDAQGALRIYLRYKELRENGQLDDALQEVYSQGQKNGFRVPTTATQLEAANK